MAPTTLTLKAIVLALMATSALTMPNPAKNAEALMKRDANAERHTPPHNLGPHHTIVDANDPHHGLNGGPEQGHRRKSKREHGDRGPVDRFDDDEDHPGNHNNPFGPGGNFGEGYHRNSKRVGPVGGPEHGPVRGLGGPDVGPPADVGPGHGGPGRGGPGNHRGPGQGRQQQRQRGPPTNGPGPRHRGPQPLNRRAPQQDGPSQSTSGCDFSQFKAHMGDGQHGGPQQHGGGPQQHGPPMQNAKRMAAPIPMPAALAEAFAARGGGPPNGGGHMPPECWALLKEKMGGHGPGGYGRGGGQPGGQPGGQQGGPMGGPQRGGGPQPQMAGA